MTLHEEVLTPTQLGMAGRLGTVVSRFGYYLAGGTAIALHLGHRRSEDFDWFVPAPGPPSHVIVSAIGEAGLHLDVDDLSPGTLLGRIPVSYTHLRAHETRHDLVCRLLLEKKKKNKHRLTIRLKDLQKKIKTNNKIITK